MSKPTIRVVVLTYNHEQFIEQALDSINRQVCGFPVSITIHDDCSTDSTPSIIRRAMKHSPYRWEFISPEKNRFQEGLGFVFDLLKSVDDTFIARLDGDDYWTNPSKLEKQAQQLLNNKDSALSHHIFSVIKDGVRLYSTPPKNFDSLSPGVSLSKENFIGSSTVMLRRESLPQAMPAGFNSLKVGDYPVWSLSSSGSNLSFIDEEMSAYRIHKSNSWIGTDVERQFLDYVDAKIYIASAVPAHEMPKWRESIYSDISFWIQKNRDPNLAQKP